MPQNARCNETGVKSGFSFSADCVIPTDKLGTSYFQKVASAETISRVLGAKKEETPAESEQSAKTETESEKPAPKKSNSRKKKKDTPAESSHPTAV